MNKLLTLILFICTISSIYAQKYTLSGYITDSGNSEKLIGASIYEKKTKSGTITNPYGFYSLTLPKGQYEIVFSFVGYESIVKEIDLSSDQKLNISLLQNLELEEVDVIGEKIDNSVESTQMSAISLSSKTIKSIPALFGEVDIIKAMQLLPGVQSGTEGASGMYVRGGGPDQNLILLDGIPVYNVNHLFGFFSVFNADAINSVNLIKGGFPARYGGRLSSVVDIRMKEGNNKKIHGSGSIGLISSKLTLEGPIIKDKMSFVISGRRTYIDVLAAPFVALDQRNSSNKSSGGYYFYDLNTKINYKFSERNRLYLSAYMGRDKAYFKNKDTDNDNFNETKFDLHWGNIITALRWNYVITNKLFCNTTLSYSRYKFLTDIFSKFGDNNTSNTFEFNYNSGIDDYAGKVEFDYIPNPNHYIRFGVNGIYHTFNPGVNAVNINSEETEQTNITFGNNKQYSNEGFAYIEDEIKFKNFKVNIGVNGSLFQLKNKNYFNIDPRFSMRYLINNNWSVKAAYTQMSQYIHLLSNSNIGLPTDLWLPVTDSISPMKSTQYAIGSAYSLNNGIDISLEGYYKDMENMIEYKDGSSFLFANKNWDDMVEVGTGRSYGLEFLIRKSTGKTTGWVGYTLSWTDRKFDNIINGKRFPAKYDRRHDLSVVVSHKFSDRFDIGASWVYGTGYATTLATETYNSAERSEIEYYDSRNGFRMNNYHRLDLSINLHKEKRWGKRTWSFGAYNVYNRKNPFFLYFDYNSGSGEYSKRNLKQVSLFPILPYVSYNFKF